MFIPFRTAVRALLGAGVMLALGAGMAHAQVFPPSPTLPPSPPALVTYKFMIGDRVQTTASLKVRSAPSLSANVLGTQGKGKNGTVVGGPVVADGYTWWNVNYDMGADGWSVEDYLTKASGGAKTASMNNPAVASVIASLTELQLSVQKVLMSLQSFLQELVP